MQSKLLVVAILAATSGAAQQTFDLVPSFQASIKEEYITSVQPLENGQLLISGRIVFNGGDVFIPNYGALLYSSGSRDIGFNEYPQMGGKITIWNTKYYCGAGQTVRRSFLDGTADPDFPHMNSDPLFASLQGGDYHVYPDGSLVVTGTHELRDSVRGFVGFYNLIWFTNTGNLDTTKTHRRGNGTLFTMAEQQDGKLLLSGFANSYGGHPVPPVFRVHPDGELDTTFVVPLQNWGLPQYIEPLNNGSILIGGSIKVIGQQDTISLVRVLNDGNLDPSFTIPVIKNTTIAFTAPAVNDATLLSDGRLIIVGNFDMINGEARSGIALLNADGTLSSDAFVDAGCGVFNYQPNGSGGSTYPYRSIFGIEPAPDGSYYINGQYKGYDDGTNNYAQQGFVSRLYGLSVGVAEHQQLHLQLYPNPATTAVTLQLEKVPTNATAIVRDALGRAVLQQRITDHYTSLPVNDFSPGLYLLEIWSNGNRVGSERLVVE